MKANAYRSKKAKGKRLEAKIAALYRQKLEIDAQPMPMSGGMKGGFAKGDILKRQFDGWVDECKNQERIAIWECWNQAREQCGFGNKPVLHFSANNKEMLTVIRTEDYFEMRQIIKSKL